MEKISIYTVPEEIKKQAEKLVNEIPGFIHMSTYRASEHPDDAHIYYVIARHVATSTFTSWLMNVSTGLTLGRYGFSTFKDCYDDVIKDRIQYHDNKKSD